MRSATPKQRATIERILHLYGLAPARVLPSAKGYRNISVPVVLTNGEMVNVLFFKRESDIVETIRRADAVSDFVAERGMPARHTLFPQVAQLGTGTGRRFVKIYNYLPGNTIPWDAYTRGHLIILGATMSRLHHLLSSYPTVSIPNVEDILSNTITQMQDYFQGPGVVRAMHVKLQCSFDPSLLEQYKELVEQCKLRGGRQVLHMDFVRGNILFDDEKIDGLPHISGILDFEKTAVGLPLFDVARTLAFLLVDCKYKSSDKVSRYFLDSGYIKGGLKPLQKITVTIADAKHDLLALLMDLFLIHDYYKFLRHNPYEALPQNEHYVRTRDILVARKLLHHSANRYVH